MNSTQKDRLLSVLERAKTLLQRPGNDFVWSSWDHESEAIFELDSFINRIQSDISFSKIELSILFAPTGPIQEVSLSSGWGDEFLRVAQDFDSASDSL
jgi:hypothetical protein